MWRGSFKELLFFCIDVQKITAAVFNSLCQL